MPEDTPLVFIVDDDPSVCRSLGRLLRSYGFDSKTFGSGPELLHSGDFQAADCMVLDVHMPGMSGYVLADQLAEQGSTVPIIFITASQEDAARRERNGCTLLQKPFTDHILIGALRSALRPESGHC